MTDWKPTWLSLPAAMAFAGTKDRQFASDVENDRGKEEGFIAGLIVRTSHPRWKRYVDVDFGQAWIVIRSLIADEKIVAEGKSLERRGVTTAVETHFANQPIPSGDATSLIILSEVPGIAPADALGPDAQYRITNGQGRYWYGVRLRAEDVFREFGSSDIASTVAESEAGDAPSTVTTKNRQRGTKTTYHEPLFEPLLNKLFKEHGRLDPIDRSWNSANKAADALAVEFQAKYPKDPLPGLTWLKEFVRNYLIRHPDLDGRK